MKHIRLYWACMTAMIVGGACSKAKLDQRSGNLPTNSVLTSSTVRLVNLGGFTDMSINGTRLTNFVTPQPDGTRYPAPTPYFPSTGVLGTTYFIPRQFLDGNDSARVRLVQISAAGGINYIDSSYKFSVKEHYNQPEDYYWVYSRTARNPVTLSYYDSLYVIPRAVSPATDPTHILVRLVNFSSAPDDAHLTGPMSLVYADGSSVSTATNQVAPGAYSDYIELPYGTYQFKVLTASNAQVPGAPVNLLTNIITDNLNTAVMKGLGVTFSPVQSFKPGGVYSIVVSVSHKFEYPYGGPGETVKKDHNAWTVITDVAPPVNLTYARIQAANAVPGSGLNILVDGAVLAQNLAYDSVGAYQTFITGTHKISIQDGGGKELAARSFDLQPNTNFTVWAFPSGGSVDFLLAQNNLSGSRNATYNGDGSDAGPTTLYTSFPYMVRFLNFCPDLPYVTFTKADGGLFADNALSAGLAAQNIPFGVNLSSSQIPFPYVTYNLNGGMSPQIQVYQSQLSIVPGNWLSDIKALTPSDFITMPAAAYPAGLPLGEPGIYTVALTGRYGTHDPSGQGAKMIIVKHNK